MNSRLELSQQERVSERFHDHPLLCACKRAFKEYQAGMRHLLFSPTEVFVEAVQAIDDILEEGADRDGYVGELWQNLLIRYKLWCPGAPDDKEYETAVCSVFYTVSVVMSTHPDSYYNEQVKDALLSEISHHSSNVRQDEDKVIVSLCQFADGLKLWMEIYSDSNAYLTDEIEAVAHGRMPRAKMKSITAKTQKKAKPDYSKYSFCLTPKGRFENKVDKALELMYNELKEKKLIEELKNLKLDSEYGQITSITEKNKLVFNAVFSGADTDYHIIWTGTTKELGYFINQLEERGALSWKSGPRKWQVTHNRIWHKHRQEESEPDEAGQYSYIIEPFDDKAFNSSLKPADTTVLDEILDMIAPPAEKNSEKRIGTEIKESFGELAYYEKYNDNDRGEKLSGGYRDRSHKPRE